MDGDQPLVVTSKHTVTNTFTAPDDYLSLLQPSEPGTTLFETNTYYNTIALTKTLTDSDVSKVISTTDVVRQVVITELLPSKSTSVMTSYIAIDAEGHQNPASPLLLATDIVKTYFVTYTYFNTYLVNGSSIVRTNVSTSSDIVTEKLYIYPTEKANVAPVTTTATAALLKVEVPPNIDDTFQTINVYATKTMMTTFTYYTTMEQGPNGEDASAPSPSDTPDDGENELVSTVVSSRTRIIENVVTESIPMKFLPSSAIKRLKLMLYGSAQQTATAENQYTTVVTLIGGQSLEITAARHPIETTSALAGNLQTASVELVADEPNAVESNETDESKNELESVDQESAATNDLEANETGQSPNQIVHEVKPALKSNATKIVKTTSSPVSNYIGSWNFNGLKALRPMIDAVAGLINTNFGNGQSQAASAPLVHTTPRPLAQSLPTIPEYITSYTDGVDQQPPQPPQQHHQHQHQPTEDDIPKPLPNIEPAIGQARNPIYIPVNGNVDINEVLNRTHGTKHKIPLLNGGIPISPGEIITADSDVILGRPTGNRPRIPLNNKNNLPPQPSAYDPNTPFNMLPPLRISPEAGDSHSVQSIQSETYVGPPPPVPHLQLPKIHSNNKVPITRQKSVPHLLGPPSFGQSNQIQMNRIRAQNKPLPPNHYIQKEQQHRAPRPNVIPIKHVPNADVYYQQLPQQQQHQQHPQQQQHIQNPHHPHQKHRDQQHQPNYPHQQHRDQQQQHVIDPTISLAANAAKNGIIEIQRIPEVFSTDLPPVHIYNLPQKIISMASSAVLIEPSSSAVYSNHQLHFADGIQTINGLPEVVESATGQPLFVNIQPSQMANVVIPHGSSSALIYGGVQEVHKSGETFDDPSPYPNDDQATFSIGHQSKSPIISAPTVEVQPAVLAAVLHSNYDSSSSSNGNRHFVKAPISSNQKVNFDSHVLSQDIDMHVPPIIFRNQDTPASIAASSSAEYYPNDIQIIHGDFGQQPNRPDAPPPSPAAVASFETNQFYSHQNHRPIHGNLVRVQSPFNVDIESINFGMSNDASSAGLSTPSSTSSASVEQNENEDRNPIEDHHKDDDYENEQGEVIQESNAVPQLIASEQATSLSLDANINRIPSYAKPTTKTTDKGHRAPFTQTEANSLWENGDGADAISNQRITEHYSTTTTTTTTTTTPFVMPSSQPPQPNRNRPPVVVHVPQIPPGMINEMYTALRYRNQTAPPAMNTPAANHGHIRKPFYGQMSNERPPKPNLYSNTLVPLQHLRPPPQFAAALAFDRRRPPPVNLATNKKHTTKQQQVDADKVHLSTTNYVSTHRPIFTKAGSQFSIPTTAATTTVTTPRPRAQPTAPNLYDPTRGKPFRAMPSQSSAGLNLNTGEIRLPEQPVTVATTTTTTTDAPTVNPFNAQANDSVRNDANTIATNNDFDTYHSHLIVPPSRSPPPTSNYPNELAVEMRPPPPVASPPKYKPFVPKLHVVPPPQFATAPPFDRRRRPQQSAAATVSTSPPTSTKHQNVEEVLGMQPPPPPPTQAKRKQKPKIEMHKVNPEHVNELNMSPPRFIRPTQTLATASSPLHPSSGGKSKLTSNYVTIDVANEPAPTSSVEIVPMDQSPFNDDAEQHSNALPTDLTSQAPPTTTVASDPDETESKDEYVRFSIGGRHQNSQSTPIKSNGDDIIIMGSEQSLFGHSEVAQPAPQSASTASFSHEHTFIASVEQIPHSIHMTTSSSSRHSDALPSTRTISTMIFNTFEPTATLSTTTAATDPLPTKYITNTKTLTVTTTKTTVIRSAGITTTLTLTLTKTRTETIVDTITHTLLQPTRIGYDPVIKPTIFTAPITMKTRMRGGSLSSVVPNPSFSIYANLDDSDHNDSEEIKSIEMDDDVEEKRENNRIASTVSSRMRIRPTTARPLPNATNESIFVVMTDRKKLGSINLNSSDVIDAALNKAKNVEQALPSEHYAHDEDDDDDDVNHPNRDEDDVTNDVSHVLLGGILIATPPRSEVSKGKVAPTKKQQKNNHYDIDLKAEIGEHLDDNVASAAADNVIDESKHDLQRITAIDECMPECKAINNEWCQNIDGVARCVCRLHFARMFADHPCQREYIPHFFTFHFLTITTTPKTATYTYTLHLAISHLESESLHYDDVLQNPSSPKYAHLMETVHDAIDRMVMQSDLRDIYHGVQIAGFTTLNESLTAAENGTPTMDKGIETEFHLQLSDNSKNEESIMDVFKRYLRQNNYSLGGTNVFSSAELTDQIRANGESAFIDRRTFDKKNNFPFNSTDFDECSSAQSHDCSENSYCFNLRGTYTCSCRDGFVDLSENPIYPGRICSGELIGCEKCSYHGTCYSAAKGDADPIDDTETELCECFQWYAGASCQYNLKSE